MLTELRTKSQITIPKDIVMKIGLREGDKLEIVEKDGVIELMPVAVYPKKYLDELRSEINEAKARILYDYLDGQEFFHNPVEHRYRSTMNVTFTSPDPDMDKKFCAEAAEAGFVNLKGHRLVGGMRASIYNAMPTEGVEKLVDFMEKFRKANA